MQMDVHTDIQINVHTCKQINELTDGLTLRHTDRYVYTYKHTDFIYLVRVTSKAEVNNLLFNIK